MRRKTHHNGSYIAHEGEVESDSDAGEEFEDHKSDKGERDQECNSGTVVGAAPDPSQRAEAGALEDKGAALDLTQRAETGTLEDEHTPDVQQASRLVGSGDEEECISDWNRQRVETIAEGVSTNEIARKSGDAPQRSKPPHNLKVFDADHAPSRSCTQRITLVTMHRRLQLQTHPWMHLPIPWVPSAYSFEMRRSLHLGGRVKFAIWLLFPYACVVIWQHQQQATWFAAGSLDVKPKG